MEGMDTSDVILALLRLENRFGITLEKITVDAGTNLLGQNINPELKGSDRNRLFGIMTTIAHPVNSQFRNYCERNTAIVKKWIRQATMISKKVTFPVLNRIEYEYIIEKTCREINSMPIARGQEFALLSPATLIYPSENEDLSIPTTISKMANVNRMFARMRLYHEMIKSIRLDILRQGSYDPSCPKGIGRGKRVLKPNIGDIIMVCNPEKHNDAKFGVVEGFQSDQTLNIRFRGDKKATAVPTRLGIPLAAACLLTTADIVEGDQATQSALLTCVNV